MEQQTVEMRAPRSGEWFRVNPDPAQRGEIYVAEWEGEDWMIAPELMPKLTPEQTARLQRRMIFIAQNRDGELFLWPVASPVPDEHPAFRAMEEWIQLQLQ